MRHSILSFALIVLGVGVPLVVAAGTPPATAPSLGEPGPQWLRESETYCITPQPTDWPALAASKVAFITHCPINREFFQRVHALGIRALPYVTFYQGFATSSF